MANINIMSEKLANMIAAGEVVDRPSSVLKELIENAIDAKATQITMEIEGFGLNLIKVTDNGIGMTKDDVLKSYLRHATSKISNEEDLINIKSLGFRGEALAAISSVSKVTIQTKKTTSEGTLITVEASKLIDTQTIATNVGTTVIVENLFYNVPARFKYIKSEFAEKQQILDLFDRLSLANPNIKMTLIYDGKLLKQTYGDGNITETLAQVYGPSILTDLITIEDHFQKMNIKLFLVTPKITKTNKKNIHIFINGRVVKNYLLQQSIIEGYNTFIMVNRYPISLLFIEMDSKLTDVNVHPQKYEIKMQNEQLLAYHIKTLITNKFKDTIQTIPTPIVDRKGFETEVFTPLNIFDNQVFQQEDLLVEEENFEYSKLPYFDYIGQLFGTYLLFQNEEALFLVDQHAAEERIRYEYYYEKLTNPNFLTKDRLISFHLDLTDKQKDIIKQYTKDINKIGFVFDDDFNIIKDPLWLKESELELAIDIILTNLEEQGYIEISSLRDSLAKDISCKGAIKANHKLNRLEVDELMKNLRKTKNPYNCPHGRPVTIKITNYDIEKMFKRIV